MNQQRLCMTCGHVGKPRRATKGHFILELVLWLCFIVPGLIYSIWRLTTRHDACASCGATTLIPTDSPMAKAHFASSGQAAPPPSGAAYSAGKTVGRLLGRK